MTTLLIGDLHLTTQPRDAYRWDVFPQLRKIIADNRVRSVVLLGDLTDEKDRHPAELVNRIAGSIVSLGKRTDPDTTDSSVHIVRGNHDGIDPDWPFFSFLSRLPNVTFYAYPQRALLFGNPVLMLPHSRNPLLDWEKVDFSNVGYVLAHVTVKGAMSESGVALRSSINAGYFRKRRVLVYSGDVHVPQTIRPVTYVGAPYPIRFGDKFKPRVILLDRDDKEHSIDLANIRRIMLDIEDVSELKNVSSRQGDQVKVRLHLNSARMSKWLEQRKAIMEEAKPLGIDIVSVELVCVADSGTVAELQRLRSRTAQQILIDYAKEKDLGKDRVRLGRDLLGVN